MQIIFGSLNASLLPLKVTSVQTLGNLLHDIAEALKLPDAFPIPVNNKIKSISLVLYIEPTTMQHANVEDAFQLLLLILCNERNSSAKSSISFRAVEVRYCRNCMNIEGTIAEGFNCNVQVLLEES